MLNANDSEALTRVSRGTPMGDFMRRYWIPACASAELESGRAPMRLMLLGERLVAFRDGSGEVGILDHRCPHRGASLFFGRNEEDGLRCVYHGWKFNVAGECLDMPNVPPDQSFSPKVRAKRYPTREHHGLVWLYMGASDILPELPAFDAMRVPPDEVVISLTQRECNWLQGLEGELDTSHFGFLHLGTTLPEEVDPANMHRFAVMDRAPRYNSAETEVGTMYCAYRPADPGESYYRYAQFMFPFWTLIPDGTFEDNIIAGAWVPMDDTHTMTTYMIWKKRSQPLRERADGSPLPGFEMLEVPFLPNTTDWFGRWRPSMNRSNDYMIDRDAQRDGSYSGLISVGIQDQAIVESMGEIVDHSLEHLAPSDRMITLTRRRLLKVIRECQTGMDAPGAGAPSLYRDCRSGAMIGPSGSDWRELYDHALACAVRPA